jgi:hypothetical protein
LAASPGAPASGPAVPYQQTTTPFPMFPAPGLEVPANPLGHERALGSLAGVLILFNASVILIFGFVYMLARAIDWQEVWVGGDWYEERVVYWEWVLAAAFMMASFGTGVAGGIASVRGTRHNLAMVSAIMLLACAVILQLDWHGWAGEPYGEIVFVLILAILPLPLLMLAKPMFTTPVAPPGRERAAYSTDAYGWSTTTGTGTRGDTRGGPS